MNVILNPSQSDTRLGDISLVANSNLTGKECYLWKILSNGGGPGLFDLPSSSTDEAFFVGASGDIQGNIVAAESPDLAENCRVYIDAACNAGDKLALSTGTWGYLTKPAAGYGAGFYTFMAEEDAVAGQLVKIRRIPDRAFTL
jgi:hypothetical protein